MKMYWFQADKFNGFIDVQHVSLDTVVDSDLIMKSQFRKSDHIEFGDGSSVGLWLICMNFVPSDMQLKQIGIKVAQLMGWEV
jgi:hypothetical protein